MLSTSKLFYNPSSGGATDPFFRYVPLLLETTTTNGQQNNTFLDSSTNNFTITRNGTPTQGSVTPYWPNGYWSNNFPSAVNSYLTIAYNAAFNIASSTPFTIEFWFNTTGFGGVTNAFISGYNGAPSGWTVSFLGASNVFSFGLGDTTILTSSSQTISVGVWYHFALVRNASNSISMYLNGTSIATPVTNSGAIGATSQGPWIGGTPGVGQYYHGYISNLRVVNGTAVYTSAFTPPTTPLTAITNTALLTCQSNRFRDNSTNNFTLTPVSTPTVQAFQPFSPAASYTSAAYGGSGYFGGSANYLSTPSISAIGTTDFSQEVWVYPTSAIASDNLVFDAGVGAGTFLILTTTTVIGGVNGAVGITSSAYTVPANQWTHLVYCRVGTTMSLFANGTRIGTTTNSTSLAAGAYKISCAADVTRFFTGYISNLRFVSGNGLSPYNPSSTTITVPTAPVTAVSGTSLLLNYTNAGIYDAAVQNNAITVGDAQASTTQSKWSPTSMKFDGTGDWLTMPGANIPALSGQFTIEFWVNFSAISSTVQTICGKWNTSLFGWLVQVNNTSVQFSYGNGVTFTATLSYATTLTTGTWYYIAITRNSSNAIQAYLNGSAIGSPTTVATSINSTSAFSIGVNLDGSQQPLNGYLQDFRLTNGVARTITTPTSAFPTR
jgi:hypothetical protein